ncbi:MAG: hypothetical protein PHR44_01875 [Candidatus Omnitrophica bacterium]|nr:hypothetical protein [Candidatus Omnitrophota bacterium]
MKRLTVRLALVLFGIAAGIFICESFLRVNPAYRSKYGLFSFKTSEKLSDIYRDIKYRPSPIYGYEFIPNSAVNVNSYGLCGPEYILKKGRDVFRILLIGDSIAAQDGTARFLESRLNTRPIHPGYKYQLWNTGVPSYDLRRYALVLKHKGLAYKPDMVMVFFCYGDLDIDSSFYCRGKEGAVYRYNISLPELTKQRIPNYLLLKHSYLYRFLIFQAESYLSGKKSSIGNSGREDAALTYLSAIKALCVKNDLYLLGVVFPSLKPAAEYSALEREHFVILRDTMDVLGIDYIDLCGLIPEEKRAAIRERRDDVFHPSSEGQGLIADIIYEYIKVHFKG